MQLTLRAARVNKGYTQRQAAELLGITKYTLSNYERGKSYPDVPIIKKIEELYQVKYESIIFFVRNNALSVKETREEE